MDDLYLDRVRRSTASESKASTEFHSALAVAAAAYDSMDWRYVQRVIRDTRQADPVLGDSMRKMDAAVRKAVRRSLGP